MDSSTLYQGFDGAEGLTTWTSELVEDSSHIGSLYQSSDDFFQQHTNSTTATTGGGTTPLRGYSDFNTDFDAPPGAYLEAPSDLPAEATGDEPTEAENTAPSEHSPWDAASLKSFAEAKKKRASAVDPDQRKSRLLQLKGGRDWSEELLNCLENAESVRFDLLWGLAQDFLFAAITYAQIIVSEVCLPYAHKTIKPIGLGGIAGGEKYHVQGILFKFAMDTKVAEKPNPLWMYGGTSRRDDLAMKAAAAELNNLVAYATTHVEELNFPMVALIDYKGFRVIAMSVLPISKETLLYGSDDGGATVHADNEELNNLLRAAAKRLNLKGHTVGLKDKKTIFGPGDLEAHLGFDGRYYVVDVGRAMPPEAPMTLQQVKEEPRAVFYKFLRPEWVVKQKKPLCSDAFSCWDCSPPQEVQKNQEEVREATRLLFENQIPAFAKKLEERFAHVSAASSAKFFNHGLSARVLHEEGINVRHLGRVRSCVTSPLLRKLILSICVGRVCKNAIREKMRDKMMEITVPCEEPFKQIIVDQVNMLLGNHEELKKQSNYFWKIDLRGALRKAFRNLLTEEESTEEYDLRPHVDFGVLLQYLLPELCNMVDGVEAELQEGLDAFTFNTSDIDSLRIATRQWHLIYFSKAMALKFQALTAKKAGFEREYRRTAVRALHALREAHNAAPFCPVIAYNLAQGTADAARFLRDTDERGEVLSHALHIYEKEVLRFQPFWTNPEALAWEYIKLLKANEEHLRTVGKVDAAKEVESLIEQKEQELFSSSAYSKEDWISGTVVPPPKFSCQKYKQAMFASVDEPSPENEDLEFCLVRR